MTAPEVDFVLDAIDTNWPGTETNLSDVPLERIDRDNSDLLDDTPVHQHSRELQEMNIVGAGTGSWSDTPIDPDYNVETERIVSVRLEGAHVSEFGAIDPQDGSHDYSTRNWSSLKDDVRTAIYTSRTLPSVQNRSNVSFKDLFIENQNDQSTEFSDYYRWDADVRFVGFETLP